MKAWFAVLFATLLLAPLVAEARTDYRAVSGALADGRIAWRAWSDALGPHLLVVDPATWVVSEVVGKESDLVERPVGDTSWDRWRAAAARHREGLQNAGIRRALPPRRGAWLTFDLCPSERPLDRSVLTDLERDARPLPVFLEVSGHWMKTHPADLSWLISERDAGRLAVTWVNHTENHYYRPGVALDQNFLLLPGTNLDAEVFAVEQRLLDRGELPSVFFRFPGLVSSPELVDRVLALGLLPLGSSAWLAKQQNVKSGAIVLTHANGNEPVGEALLEQWDRGHRPDLADGQWHWLGLPDWADAQPAP
jgi:peptidoglycan/xylan/chitin deacetylase (PgdA/CDA1 family)